MVQLLAEKLNIFPSKIHRYQGKSTLRVLLRETETFWPKLKSRFLEGYLIFFQNFLNKTMNLLHRFHTFAALSELF